MRQLDRKLSEYTESMVEGRNESFDTFPWL
jgi:hypothetical protein